MSTAPVSYGDPSAIPQLIAQHIHRTAGQDGSVSVWDLTNAISEVTPETQTIGPALLQLTLIDPDHKILRSGICSRSASGLLQPIDVNFPEGSPVWWRLAMVELQDSDGSQPNLTLTFQHRLVAYLMRCNQPPIGWPHGKTGTTRAQFIKFLLDKMPSELPTNLIGPASSDGSGAPGDFQFVCPELNEIQPIASANTYGTEIVTAQSAAAIAAGVNKLRGLTSATSITIEGAKPSRTQIENLNTILGVGQTLGASATAMAAAMYAAIGETALGGDPNTFSGDGGSQGVFQTEPGDYDNGTDLTGQANGFFTGGKDFQAGGAIKLANEGLPIWKIANAVEANAVYDNTGQDSYASRWAGGTKQGEAEASAIVNAYNGGTSGVVGTSESDIAELERGTPDNPYEDSWTCMQRLASEVNWSLFTSVQPVPGQWGNFLYYIDGTTMAAQKPSLYVSLSNDGSFWIAQDPDTGKFLDGSGDGMLSNADATMDNTAFQVYQATDLAASTGATSGSAKVTKATRVQQPQTPSTFMFNLVLGRAGVLQYNGGDVFVVRNAGPFDGRWIVEDVTHNILADEFAQVTLGPPEFAYPEPQADTVAVTGADGQPVNVPGSPSAASSSSSSTVATALSTIQQGALAGVAQAAEKALALQKASKGQDYTYLEVRPMPSSLFGSYPVITDCSGFATLCYKAAGLPDPNGPAYDYNGRGNTDSLIAHCTKISEGSAQPGDLCFFGTVISGGYTTTHVNVYIGGGQSISMGIQGDPSQGQSQLMGPGAGTFLGWFRSNYVSQINVFNPVQSPLNPSSTLGTSDVQTSKGSNVNAGVFSNIFTPLK